MISDSFITKYRNVVVADDHPIYRKGVVDLFTAISPEIRCFEAQNGKEAVDILSAHAIDLACLDIDMPIMDGIEVATVISEQYHQIDTMILTMHSSPRQIADLIGLGVKGYVLKSVDEEELKKALLLIADGSPYLSPVVHTAWVSFLMKKKSEKNARNVLMGDELTKREIEIIELICKQFNVTEIADKLSISELTVRSHRAHIFKKTGANNVVGLVVYAIKNDIFNP